VRQRPTTDAQRGTEGDEDHLDRKLSQLVDEVRVALPGVQVLFAFLLIAPFNQGWHQTSGYDRKVYVMALMCAAAASILLMATSAFHRHRFPRLARETAEDKREVIAAQDRLAVGGLIALSAAVCASMFLVFDVLFDARVAGGLVFVIGLAYGWFWYGLPMLRRWKDPRSGLGPRSESRDGGTRS
jgi:hypothetical protein